MQSMVTTMVRSMEVHSEAEIPLQPKEGWPHTGRCLKAAVTQWEACAGSGARQDLWAGAPRSPCWNRFGGRMCDCKGDPHWNSLFLKDCIQWKGPILEQFGKNCNPWEGAHAGPRKKCEEFSPWGRRSSRDNMWWTDTDPIPCSSVLWWRRGDRKSRMILRSERKEWYREGVLRFVFYFPLPYSGLIGNRLN